MRLVKGLLILSIRDLDKVLYTEVVHKLLKRVHCTLKCMFFGRRFVTGTILSN